MQQSSAMADIAREARAEGISYPLSYKAKDIEHQLDILERLWPNLDTGHARALAERLRKRPHSPKWIEAPFCIVDPNFFGSYAEAVMAVLDALVRERSGYRTSVEDRLREVYLEGRDLHKCVKLSRRTQQSHDALRRTQKGTVWIVYGQFGWHHRSLSVEEVRKSYGEHEYGFGLLEACCMLLTHRRRLVNSRALQIECPGDKFRPRRGTDFTDAAFMHVHGGRLSVDVCDASIPSKRAGSLTGIIPTLEDLRPSL